MFGCLTECTLEQLYCFRYSSDRYARLNHGYNGVNCSEFHRLEKPDACQNGADDAQSMVAISSLVRNLLTLASNSIIGSISDARGRRSIVCLLMFLYILPPLVLIILQLCESANPIWYYAADSSTGLVQYMSIFYAMLGDLMPKKFRAPSFGLFLATYYIGFSIGPQAPMWMSHFYASVLSFSVTLSGFAFAFFGMPETLPPDVAERNLSARTENAPEGRVARMSNIILCPIREMSILNRDPFFRLLAAGFFFSGIVYSSDATLVIYYIEDQLDIRDKDLAFSFLFMGVIGIIIDGLLLQRLIACLGEKGMTVAAFVSGTCHNLLYGLARGKCAIYAAFCLSQLTKTNFPMIASIAANNVGADEQGRVQGALFSLAALADAIGPISLGYIYKHTKDRKDFGPGTMFLVASFLYATGTVLVSFLPVEKTNAVFRERSIRPDYEHDDMALSLENGTVDAREPLLDEDSGS